ncbi:cytosine permease [Kutzneria viridogrisea]|uniref:Cytosine permease n=2 Tax=Kutzneria TaxID=43356 RepID=W5WRM2_9PSEU|nr:cytosine permease [Kutzneria albida]AHI00830.1 hypothetical protein KALB_7472 [Kutzneria albida DSM 43870]MBA8926107.1 cytosine permease [Kutzneria viridogrisea]
MAELDDYALTPVPTSARRTWFSVALQRFGQVSSFHQFLLGSALGFSMTFTDALIAITIGSVILEVVTILLGVIGVREGLSVSRVAARCGFGRRGSALVGLLITISLVGWFGVQNGAFAEGLHNLLGGPPLWVWSLVGGAVVTAVVVYGFRAMAWIAYVMVPAFMVLAAISIAGGLSTHSWSELLFAQPAGPHMSLVEGTTLVAGAFFVGAVMTPDMTRFNRSPADVVKQTVLAVTLGEYGIGLVGVLMAHAAGTADVVSMISSSSGFLGTLVLVSAIVKINDWNLYSSSLGLVNTIDVLFSRRVSRAWITVPLGVLGSVLSAVGILDKFTSFLTAMAVLTPPVAGIMIAEYFLVRPRRSAEQSEPEWVPAALVCWALGSAAGWLLPFGIPPLNSLLVSFLGYLALTAVRTQKLEEPRVATDLPE